MASIKLQGSTSGEITISAPAVAGTNTLTLPATTGSLMTSTFTGDINFDSDTLVVDSTNNRVGIGTSSPSGRLDISSTGIPYTNIVTTTPTGIASGITILASASAGEEFIAYRNAMRFGTATGVNAAGFAERMRIDSNGYFMVNNTSVVGPAMIQSRSTLVGTACYSAINTAGAGGQFMYFVNSANNAFVGSITNSGNTGTAYNTSSDYRLKENVNYTFDATSRLKQLKPARFNFIADTDRTVDGFIAHEVSDIVPEAVTGEKDAMMTEEYEVTPAVLDDDGNIIEEAVMGTREVPDYQGIDQSKLVPLLVKTCQEQQTIIEDLQTRITALENN